MKISSFNQNNYNRYNQPAFGASPVKVAEASAKSSFFKPITDSYDKMTDVIADRFTSKFVNWLPVTYFADKFSKSKNLFQHCLTIGSFITSGLYMQRTLTNKDLDKDRRQTLAVNQGLTLGVSTAGAYLLDKYLNSSWDNVTARFAGHLLGDDKFYSQYLKEKKSIIEENKRIKLNTPKGSKPEFKSMPDINKLVEKHSYYKTLMNNKNSQEAANELMTKVKGMKPLKTMIVFGFVYRYFVPVVVTKPANWLSEKYLENKKNKKNSQVA